MWNRPQSTHSQPEAPAQARLDTSLEDSHQAKTGGGGHRLTGQYPPGEERLQFFPACSFPASAKEV